ncbi:Uncharacterised protein [Mycobacterium tuberculosis]|nr:Uncharacterised protein [Mycobacterium tuberculosis]
MNQLCRPIAPPSSEFYDRDTNTEVRYPFYSLRGRYRVGIAFLQEHLSEGESRTSLRSTTIHHAAAVVLYYERFNDVPVRV